MYVEGTLENCVMSMIVDTGSSISILSGQTLRKFGLDMSNVQPVKNSLRSVTGEKMSLFGRIVLKLRIANRDFFQSFWIADMNEECILGCDFLEQHGCCLDMTNKCMMIEDVRVPLLDRLNDDGGHGFPCYRVVAMQDTCVEPHTEVIVPAKIMNYNGKSEFGIIEAMPGKATPELLVGKVLTNLSDAAVPVRLANVSNEVRSIKAGSELAKCELVTHISDESCMECNYDRKKNVPAEDQKLPSYLESLYENSIKDLTSEDEKTKVYNLLCENTDIFSQGPNDLGRTKLVKHKINTGNAKPIKQPPRRLPYSKRTAANQAITDMENQGIIEPSTSPWASPIVLVEKKDGSLRFCVDYRKLNNITVKDSYPLPRIDDTLDALGGSQWFSTLDLKSGYWQVEMDSNDKEKTAFGVAGGLWQFRVMPFGLCNAPATFERLMDHVLVGLPWTICMVYLDDIIVHGRTFDQELVNLTQVFSCIRNAGLKLAPSKCSLFRQKVKYILDILSARMA